MIEVKGKSNTVARVLADSVNEQGDRLLSYEIEVPRIVWAEFLTHGMICRNAASSRAIPFAKMVEQLNGRPVRFGQANKGMQDKGEDYDAMVEIPGYLYVAFSEYMSRTFNLTIEKYFRNGRVIVGSHTAWDFHRFLSVGIAGAFNDAGYHKQIYNRPTEAHQIIKAVASATELENFFWLRKDSAADPTLECLAQCMYEAREQSKPELLLPGEWHLPYIGTMRDQYSNPMRLMYYIHDAQGCVQWLTLDEAIKVSAARCAAVSFRKEDYGLEDSLRVYEKLVGDERKHASAFQHQATPMKGIKDGVNCAAYPLSWEPGISHADREGNLWSAQYKGWVMNRKLIPGENYTGQHEN